MMPKSAMKFFAVIMIAVYFLTLFESPTVSYADEKSSRAKSEAERWRRNNRLADAPLSTELKVILVATGILLVVVVIHKIAKTHGDDQEQESEAQKNSTEQACTGDASQALSVQTKRGKDEQKSSSRLLKRKPLIPSER